MAAILLFGRDDVINSCAPGAMTDALVRRVNTDRFDDRLMVRTNLIEAYDKLIDFINKHTMDRFFLVDNQRVSVRSWIAREIVSNILVHREYSKGYPAKVIIEADRLYAENWNRSNRHGRIDPNNFTPEAKNPTLAWFFVNIGRADWMGSGIRNLYKYTKIYSGGEPELFEGDIFKTIVPLKGIGAVGSTGDNTGAEVTSDLRGILRGDLRSASTQVSTQDERITSLLDYCAEPRTRDEMQQHYGIATREYFRKNVLKPLLESGQLEMTIPDKPNSRNQKYVAAGANKDW